MTSETSPVCRSCGADELSLILDLGRTPLANALIPPGAEGGPERLYPLQLAYCTGCSLVQILETVPPEDLFSHYLYQSSWSDTMLAHAGQLAADLLRTRRLDGDSLVVEAASNDGYLLQHYQRAGIPVLGIEPAANIAEIAVRERNVPTLVEFFGVELAERLRNQKRRADVFHAHNVLAHVADLNGFVAGVARLLAPGGAAVIEAPYVRDLVDHCEFDTIYHEHLCYFSLTALDHLMRRHGLVIQEARRAAIHGGSLRIYVGRAGDHPVISASVARLLEEERRTGVASEGYYQQFAGRVRRLKRSLVDALETLKQQGRRIAAYGASAKGSTLLNYCGIGRETLDYVVDRSPLKQGRLTPGQHLAIHDPSRLLEDQPDYLLLLTWNFAEEILQQQAEYRRRGGKFITPVPDVRVA